MNEPMPSMMRTSRGAPVPLRAVAVAADIEALFAEVRIDQTYENSEDAPIEAVFTFPLPVDAVLLGLTVTLGDKHLTGVIVAKAQGDACNRISGVGKIDAGDLQTGPPSDVLDAIDVGEDLVPTALGDDVEDVSDQA